MHSHYISHHIHKQMIRTSLLLLLIGAALTQLPPQNPIIGIYTEDAQDFGQPSQEGQTYIAASYVKNLQMAGAQVVPIFYHYSTQQLAALLPKINGVFFPGGEMPIDNNNQWTSNIGFILNFAKKENDMGRSFPLWATCLGYEAVMYITSGLNDNMTVLTRVNGQRGLRGNLTVTNTNSPLIRSLSVKEYEEVTKGEGLLWFHHTWAVTLETYNAQTPLNSFWKLVSTSVTEDNVVFVSTVEARNYPFFMTQYHPEKNSYEWKIDAARSYDAVSVQMKFISEFVKIARLSPNRMEEVEWKQRWIYNYSPLYSLKDPDFTQVYLFDESTL